MPAGKMFNGRVYGMALETTSKAVAIREAKAYRVKGFLARAVPRNGGFAVFAVRK